MLRLVSSGGTRMQHASLRCPWHPASLHWGSLDVTNATAKRPLAVDAQTREWSQVMASTLGIQSSAQDRFEGRWQLGGPWLHTMIPRASSIHHQV